MLAKYDKYIGHGKPSFWVLTITFKSSVGLSEENDYNSFKTGNMDDLLTEKLAYLVTS